MAAVTSTLLAAGGLGLNAAQMVKANKDKQAAQTAAAKAVATAKGVRQQNAFQALQAPDLKSMSDQMGLQQHTRSVEALQDMGAEGAAQIANLDQSARMANLQTAERQGQVNFQRDTMEAQAQQGINQEQAATERNMAMMQLEGAQGAAADADYNRTMAIQGMFGGAGQMLGGVAGLVPLYREKGNAKNQAFNTPTVPEIKSLGGTTKVGMYNSPTVYGGPFSE